MQIKPNHRWQFGHWPMSQARWKTHFQTSWKSPFEQSRQYHLQRRSVLDVLPQQHRSLLQSQTIGIIATNIDRFLARQFINVNEEFYCFTRNSNKTSKKIIIEEVQGKSFITRSGRSYKTDTKKDVLLSTERCRDGDSLNFLKNIRTFIAEEKYRYNQIKWLGVNILRKKRNGVRK